MKRITVLLAEDHVIVREGLRNLLELEDDLEVVGEASNGREAVALAQKIHPEVVLMDISMPLLNGLEAARQLIQIVPDTKVIMLTAYNDDNYVQNAMASGAVGFLIKQTSAFDVCQAIREVQKGHTFFSPEISRRLEQLNPPAFNLRGKPSKKVAQLTSRQMEVVQLIAEGKSNREIAAELGLSCKTVEKHREHLMEKLNLHDTAGLTRYAISTGIIENSVQLTIV